MSLLETEFLSNARAPERRALDPDRVRDAARDASLASGLASNGVTVLAKSFPAVAESVPVARARIATFAVQAGASGDRLEAIRMAASEALTNVVVHAYRGGPGQIHAMAWALREDFWLLVADDGCGLRSGEPSNGLGRGLALMAQLADELTIVEGACGGTEVRMRFMLGARDRASHAGPFAAAA